MIRKFLAFAIVAVVVFLVSGGVSFTSYMASGYSYNDPNPKQTSVALGALSFVTLGALGLGMVGLSTKNWADNQKLAYRQMYVGFSFVFGSYVALELLWKLTV